LNQHSKNTVNKYLLDNQSVKAEESIKRVTQREQEVLTSGDVRNDFYSGQKWDFWFSFCPG
jgi:hypothetical protein